MPPPAALKGARGAPDVLAAVSPLLLAGGGAATLAQHLAHQVARRRFVVAQAGVEIALEGAQHLGHFAIPQRRARGPAAGQRRIPGKAEMPQQPHGAFEDVWLTVIAAIGADFLGHRVARLDGALRQVTPPGGLGVLLGRQRRLGAGFRIGGAAGALRFQVLVVARDQCLGFLLGEHALLLRRQHAIGEFAHLQALTRSASPASCSPRRAASGRVTNPTPPPSRTPPPSAGSGTKLIGSLASPRGATSGAGSAAAISARPRSSAARSLKPSIASAAASPACRTSAGGARGPPSGACASRT